MINETTHLTGRLRSRLKEELDDVEDDNHGCSLEQYAAGDLSNRNRTPHTPGGGRQEGGDIGDHVTVGPSLYAHRLQPWSVAPGCSRPTLGDELLEVESQERPNPTGRTQST